jgi:hypothetical protein
VGGEIGRDVERWDRGILDGRWDGGILGGKWDGRECV